MIEKCKKENRNIISLMAVGDIMLGGRVAGEIERHKARWMFADANHILTKADFAFGNLEGPLVNAKIGRDYERKYSLGAKEEVADDLKDANFKVLSIANNHIMDYGKEGLRNTIRILGEKGIKWFGAGMNLREATRPAILKGDKYEVAFLGFAASDNAGKDKEGTAPVNNDLIKKVIRDTKSRIQGYVIVSIHAGVEYADFPLDSMKRVSRNAIECGAKVVLGHHPHVIQSIESYKGGIIAYSLGNFVFDFGYNEARDEEYKKSLLSGRYGVKFEKNDNRVNESMILEITIDNEERCQYNVHPVFIGEDFKPRIQQGTEAEEFKKRLENLSLDADNDTSRIQQVLKAVERDSLRDYYSNKGWAYLFKNLHKLKLIHLKELMKIIRK